MYTLGMYFHNTMGRMWRSISVPSWRFSVRKRRSRRRELRKTLRHELTHHLEGLAGDRSLEKWDERHRAELLARMNGSPPDSPLFAGGYTGPGEDSALRRRRRPAPGAEGRR
jgi:hypothetical protein